MKIFSKYKNQQILKNYWKDNVKYVTNSYFKLTTG